MPSFGPKISLSGSGLLTGYGAPGGNNPATATAKKGDSYFDLTNFRFYRSFDGSAWPTSYVAFGSGLIPVTSRPDASVGYEGQSAILLSSGELYGPKGADGSWPDTGLKLAGAASSGGSVSDDDITANSLTLEPVSGDSAPSQLQLLNSAGNQTFFVDPAGNATVAGTFAVTGATTAQTLNAGTATVSSLTTTGPAVFDGSVTFYAASKLASVEISTGTVDDDWTVKGNLNVNGAANLVDAEISTLHAASGSVSGNLGVGGQLSAGAIKASSLQVGTGSAAGSTTLFGPFVLSGGATLDALTVSGDSHLGTVETTGAAIIGGSVTATGSGKLASLELTNTGSGSQLTIDGTNGPVFSVDSAGNTTLAGTLTVAGAETNSALNAGALTATSFVNSGQTHLEQTLLVDGVSTLGNVQAQDVSATTLETSGSATISGPTSAQALSATALTTQTAHVTGGTVLDGALGVGGKATLGTTQTGALTASTVTTSGLEVDGNEVVTGSITAQGALSAASVSTGALTASGKVTAGSDLSVGGSAVVSSAITAKQCTIAGNSAAPWTIEDASGTVLASVDGQGRLSCEALTVSGQGSGSATNAGALTVTSLTDTGMAAFQQNVTIAGNTSAQALTATAVTAQALTTAGNASIGGNEVVSGNLQVIGSSQVASLSAGSVSTLTASVVTDAANNGGTLSVAKKITTGEIQTGQLTTTNSNVSQNETVGGALSVTGNASIGGGLTVTSGATTGSLSTGAITATSATLSSSLQVGGNEVVSGTLSVGGQTTVPAITVQLPASGASATPLLVKDASGNTLVSSDGMGNFSVAGTLSVAGAQTNTATNAGALQCTSFIDSGNAVVQGTFQAQGATTLASASATSLSVSGQATLGTTSTGALTPSSVAVTNNGTVGGTFQVFGATTLAALQAGAVTASSLSTSGNVSVGNALTVQGQTTLGTTQAAGLTVQGLTDSGNATIGGTLGCVGAATFNSTVGVTGAVTLGSSLSASGQLSAQALAVKLPSSGASATPLTVTAANNANLLSLDSSGNLSIPGTITASNAGTSTSTGALSATSIADSGTLTVQGASTLAGVSATNISASGTLQASGATTLAGVSATSISASGTLSAQGQTTLAALSAAAISATSLTTTGAVSVGTTLGVSGQSTLAATSASSLSVSGTAALGAVTASSVAVTLPASNATAPIVVKSNGGTTLLSADTSGNVTAANVSGANVSASGTLSVAGASSVAGLTSTATVQAKNLTLTSGGAGSLTFADGTVQSTAASNTNPAGSVFLQGSGPPNATNAPSVVPGNIYIDTNSSLAYGPSTSASYTGLTNITNLVGPQGVPGPAVTRNSAQGIIWMYSGITANQFYPVYVVISGQSFSTSATGYNVPMVVPMYSAGQLVAVTAASNGGIAATISVNVLKNGSVWASAPSIYTATTTVANTGASKNFVSSNLTFAAGDIITMQIATNVTTNNQNYQFGLYYNTSI